MGIRKDLNLLTLREEQKLVVRVQIIHRRSFKLGGEGQRNKSFGELFPGRGRKRQGEGGLRKLGGSKN